jgi:hypothetical protein
MKKNIGFSEFIELFFLISKAYDRMECNEFIELERERSHKVEGQRSKKI